MAQLTTFVFTDLVGSVALKQQMPGVDAAERDAEYVQRVLTPHRERIEAGLHEAEGRVVSTAGDGHFIVFPDSARAALWAIGVVGSHEIDPIAVGESDRAYAEVRIGMHSGTPQPDPADPDNFVGRAVDYAARLADHAQGGQILVSRTTAALIEDGDLEGVSLHSHGEHSLKGIGSTELYELLYPQRKPAKPRRTPSDAASPRDWDVLPRTMGITEYAAQSGSRPSAGSSATAVRPHRVGNYELDELLGAGGMGNVYKARHPQLDRPRAVKVIRPDLVEAGGDSVVRRFYQEVRATGSLEHPNLVVAIDSSSPDDDEHYLVMEYIDGVSVDQLLEEEGPLSVADACEIARQAALGLAHLHDQGLVHRDVKPSNLMATLVSSAHLPIDVGSSDPRSRRGSSAKLPIVKLMDLGLALLQRGDEERVTQFDRGGMGTGYYMPPEQWQTTSVDIRADLYSLGCTLYHLLTGEPPYARSELRPDRAHAREPIPQLTPGCGAPPALVDLLERLLAKSPDDRPQTPVEVAEALAPLAAGHHLAERLNARGGGKAASRAAEAFDTQPNPLGRFETEQPLGRNQTESAGSALAHPRNSWLVAGLATLIACTAVVGLAYVRNAMLERRLDNLERTARFAASDIADAIDKRVRTLEELADSPVLRELVTAAHSGGTSQLQQWLIANRADYDEELNLRSSSWFITDAQGVQIARARPSKKTLGQSFAHRDYFHGQGHDLDKNPDPPPAPISDSHKSTVYASGSTGELKVAFSTPVKDNNEVLGVLAMSVMLGDFAEFRRTDDNAGAIEILLVDMRNDFIGAEPQQGLVLHHRDLGQYARDGIPVRLSPQLLEPEKGVRLGDRELKLRRYDDVFDRNEGSFWGVAVPVAAESLPPDKRGSWVVIAQEPKG